MTLTAASPDRPDVPPASPAAIDPADGLAVAKARAALSKRDGAVLRELTLLADRHGQASPSQTELAAACRMSERTVRTAVKVLQDLGWITREPVSAGKGGRQNDRYTVHAAPVRRG